MNIKIKSLFIRSPILPVLCICLCSCSTVEYRKGLALDRLEADRKHVQIQEHDSGIVTDQPRLEIQIGPNPDFNYLAIGPLIPIIPWLPGIAGVIFSHKKYQIPNANVEIRISFAAAQDGRELIPSHFIFSPQNAKLIIGNKIFYPMNSISWFYCTSENKCDKLTEDKYSISTSTATYLYPGCVLTYEIWESEITEAELDIENIEFNGKSMNAPKLLIRPRSAIGMGYIGP